MKRQERDYRMVAEKADRLAAEEAARVAAEVARSPKVGLVQKLMSEGRLAFVEKDYPRSIVKSLAAEELLRKYGGILAPNEEAEIREQLQFLKIQYFLLSGQAGEAFRVLNEVRHRSHPYLWHRKMAARSGVFSAHWRAVEVSLRQYFKTNRSGQIFTLLGYVVGMGEEPERLDRLAEELRFVPSLSERLYESLLVDYRMLTGSCSPALARLLPEYLATEVSVTPLVQQGNTLFVGSSHELSQLQVQELEFRLEVEIVPVPVPATLIEERNRELY